MTTFFDITDAQRIHIELLPSNTVAVSAYLGDWNKQPHLILQAWAPRQTDMKCVGGGSEDEFLETYCYDCEWYTEDIEIDLDYHDITVYHNDEPVTLTGYGHAYSPCSCASEGVGDVEFPCIAGHDGPDATESDETLNGQHMAYGIVRNVYDYRQQSEFAFQQGLYIQDNLAYETNWQRCCNTFDGDYQRICWGMENTPTSLQGIELTFTTGFANEDLLSFESHNENAEDIHYELDNLEVENEEPSQKLILAKYDGRPMGLAAVAAVANTKAFMYMATTGCKIRKGVAFTPVSLYRNVALSDDVVMDVWTSDPLVAGTRLAFIQVGDEYQLIGQLQPDFDLTPCNSINAPSSDAEALDNSSCPA